VKRLKETCPMRRRLLNPKHPLHRNRGNFTEMLLNLEKESPGVASWFLNQVPKGVTVAEFTRSIIIDLYNEEDDLIKEKLLV